MWKPKHRERKCLHDNKRPTSGGQFVPDSVFLTVGEAIFAQYLGISRFRDPAAWHILIASVRRKFPL